MRIVSIALLQLFSAFAFGQQDSLVIKGMLKGQGNEKVSVSFTGENGKPVSYSAVADKNAFVIKIKKQSSPVVARFSSGARKNISKTINGRTVEFPSAPLEFFIGQSDLDIQGDVNHLTLAQVKGDPANNDYARYKQSVSTIEKREEDIRDAFFLMDENDTVQRKKMLDEISIIGKEKRQIQKKFIEGNPSSFASLFLLSRMENLYTTGDYEYAFNNLGNDYK